MMWPEGTTTEQVSIPSGDDDYLEPRPGYRIVGIQAAGGITYGDLSLRIGERTIFTMLRVTAGVWLPFDIPMTKKLRLSLKIGSGSDKSLLVAIAPSQAPQQGDRGGCS